MILPGQGLPPCKKLRVSLTRIFLFEKFLLDTWNLINR